jgi:ABC-type branched-subunit amino acid transport system substrate-binding protein
MKKNLRKIGLGLSAALAVTASGVASAQNQNPIKIGVVTPLSGTYAPIGQQVKWGTELAVQEINAAGGINGRPVQLLFEDGEANPAVVTRKAEKLFQNDKVDFLTGVVNSGATIAVGQVAERNNRLASTSVSLSDAITGARCSPNLFRVNPPGGMQATGLAQWIKQNKPDARIFAIGPDYEMGRDTVAGFQKKAKELGLNVVGEIFPPLGEKDYTPYFGQIRQARPDVIYTSTAGNDTVRLFSQMQEYGLLDRFTMVGASVAVTAQNLGAMGKTAEGFMTVAGYSPDLDTAANQQFVQNFKKAFNAEPDLYGADSYGVVSFYKSAVEKAGSTDTDKVREAMRGLNWQTPQGEKQMRAGDHQAVMDVYVLQVKGGDFTILDKIEGQKAIGPDNCERF